jgi:hypothetical protein
MSASAAESAPLEPVFGTSVSGVRVKAFGPKWRIRGKESLRPIAL